LSTQRCEELGLDSIVDADEQWQPTVSINLRTDVRFTGPSPEGQSRTILAAIDERMGRKDFIRPGYVNPLRGQPRGVFDMPAPAEAAIDLARLAGCVPAAVVSLIVNPDGTVALGDAVGVYAESHSFPMVTVQQVVSLRLRSEKLVKQVTSVNLPTSYGEFRALAFEEEIGGAIQLALINGEIRGREGVLVGIHAECLAGDVFQARTCSCRSDLERMLETLSREPCGLLVYFVSDRSGESRLRRHMPFVSDTYRSPSPLDHYALTAQICARLGVKSLRLLSDDPLPLGGLGSFGLRFAGRLPLNRPS
jgi:3,4-dihydroxy 2-butanone 4-phosphate synthase/GTP cyclohydrolase II